MERGCVGDQPQNAALFQNRCHLPSRTLLRPGLRHSRAPFTNHQLLITAPMKFIHEDFLLQTRTAKRLYHTFAEEEPIFDYHCHLPPRDIAENRQFNNLSEIWLEGDHYKWRAMRANGVAEKFCTGDADPFAKFQAWAATVPHTLRNPLYH